MMVDKTNNKISHEVFTSIVDHMGKGDVLVVNDTKVLPARLLGVKTDTHGSVELLLLHETTKDTWHMVLFSKTSSSLASGDQS